MKDNKLINSFGPKTIQWLKEVNITEDGQFIKMGALNTYLLLKRSNSKITLNMLWGLSAALMKIKASELPLEIKEELKKQLKDMHQ